LWSYGQVVGKTGNRLSRSCLSTQPEGLASCLQNPQARRQKKYLIAEQGEAIPFQALQSLFGRV
jgi:hypothetical protein